MVHEYGQGEMSRKSEKLETLLRPVVEGLGFDLWGLEYVRGRGAILRLYIDSDNDITVDDCAAVSHQVSGVLDVEDPISGEYTLEVSSPGVERPLFSLSQWLRYLGAQVQVRLLAPHEGKRRFVAVIKGVEGDDLLLEQDGKQWIIPFAQIDRANLVMPLD